jgi:hypothetical protein
MRRFAFFRPEGREEGVDQVNLEVHGSLAACLGYEYAAIDHGTKQQRDAHLRTDAAAQDSPLFPASRLDDSGAAKAL